MSPRRLTATVLTVLLFAAWSGRALAVEPLLEYDVKLAYLYHFFSYVRWPADLCQGDVVIGLIGQGPTDDQLQKLLAKQVGGRKIVVQHWQKADEIRPCHLVFVCGKDDAAKQLLVDVAARVGGQPTLLVAETAGSTKSSAAVNFIFVGSNVKFEINRGTLAKAGLQADARLLRVAAAVLE